MRHLLLASEPDSHGRITLRGRDARYLSRVLRLGVGDSFRALSPGGHREYTLRIYEKLRDSLSCELCAEKGPADLPVDVPALEREKSRDRERAAHTGTLPRTILMQGWPKGQKLDLVVRQAGELGVADVIVFVGEHAVVRPDVKDFPARIRRFERVAKEAVQQSGAAQACRIHLCASTLEALDLRDTLLAGAERVCSLLMHQDVLAQNTLHRYLDSTPDTLVVAVGPEGGFSPGECSLFMERGFLPFVLGPTVLRTETAALFALAAAQIIMLEKSSWHIRTPSCPM